MDVKFTKNHYRCAKRVTWDDVMKKMHNDDEENNKLWVVGDPPTFVCRSLYTPKTIYTVKQKVKLPELHVYVSFLKESESFGHHKDHKHVLLVQAIGVMRYDVEDIMYELHPGDSLFIPAKVYHTPHPMQPRATLSFSPLTIIDD